CCRRPARHEPRTRHVRETIPRTVGAWRPDTRIVYICAARGDAEEERRDALDSSRVTGSDDIIGTLSTRVSELSKRVALLQAELDGANRRVAVYEEHDKTIQDAISGALRSAYTIRERAETTAEQILEQAREERRLLLKEIERLRDERDNLQEEIATQRRSGIAAVAPRPLSSDTVASDRRPARAAAHRGRADVRVHVAAAAAARRNRRRRACAQRGAAEGRHGRARGRSVGGRATTAADAASRASPVGSTPTHRDRGNRS